MSTHNQKNRFLNFLIGDTAKWKQVPYAIKEMWWEMKDHKDARWNLIFIGLLSFSITFGGMYTLNEFQQRAQYCDVLIADEKLRIDPTYQFMVSEEEILQVFDKQSLPTPPTNKSYKYYVNYYKQGKKQPWVGLN